MGKVGVLGCDGDGRVDDLGEVLNNAANARCFAHNGCGNRAKGASTLTHQLVEI